MPVSLHDLASPARVPPDWIAQLFRFTDLLVAYTVLGALLGYLPRGTEEFLALRVQVLYVLAVLIFGVLWNRTFSSLGLYVRSTARTTVEELRRVFLACSIIAAPTFAFLSLSRVHVLTLGCALLFWTGCIAATLGTRAGIRLCASTFSNLRRKHIIIVGTGPRARMLHHQLSLLTPGPELVGFVDSKDQTGSGVVSAMLIGGFHDLENLLMRRIVDEVLIALPIKSCYQAIQDIIHTCERLGIQSTYLSDIFPPSFGRVTQHSHPFPARTVKVVQDDSRVLIKRGIDVIGSIIGLTLLAPLMLGIAIAIEVTGSGPAIYSQERYGFGKRTFTMYKFRSMVADAESLLESLEDRNEADGPVFKIMKDPRVTKLGRVLRKTSLDELPQLWNVLKGEMSLVGPRPLSMRDVGRFEEGWLMRRFSVRPGLTCLWQVSGRSTLGFKEWVTLDLRYIDTWSLRLDGAILLRTIPAVISGIGAA